MADYHQERQQRLNQRIDEAFPSVGSTQPAHEGSQSSAPDASTTPMPRSDPRYDPSQGGGPFTKPDLEYLRNATGLGIH